MTIWSPFPVRLRAIAPIVGAMVLTTGALAACGSSDDSNTGTAGSGGAAATTGVAGDPVAGQHPALDALAGMVDTACANTGGELRFSSDLFGVEPANQPEYLDTARAMFFDRYRTSYDESADVSLLEAGLCSIPSAELVSDIAPSFGSFVDCAEGYDDEASAEYYCLESSS